MFYIEKNKSEVYLFIWLSRSSLLYHRAVVVDEGVLNYRETTGKGGYRRIYSPKMEEGGFKKYIAKTVIESLLRDFPDESREVIKEFSLP